ncbi:MAG: alpha/beta hydrolase [Candidatus Eremiobacteraeota bacterium]|nr:alpha/beta hydrolase [Candidatus Eremiobacteraeota bacterium]
MSSQTVVPLDDGAHTTLELWGDHGPVMLCVHGMTSSRKSWARVAQKYSDRFRVYAYDQRGHGDSADVPGPMTLHRSVKDLANVIAAIAMPINVLMGHSWGGAIVLLGGQRFDIGRVVAIDPMLRQGTDIWYAEFLGELEQLFSLDGDARDAAVRDAYADWNVLDRESKVYALHAMGRRTLEGLRDENPAQTWDLHEELTDYPKPVLFAMADPSQSIVTREDAAFVERSVGANATFAQFPGASHSLQRTDFERFIEILDNFLASTQ